MIKPSRVAVIGFGEAGGIIAEGCLSGAKHLGEDISCHAWDIRMQNEEDKNQLQQAADNMGVVMHNTPGAWLNDVDVVFSLVFGGVAKKVALEMLPFLKEGAVYIDLTTSTPHDMREAAESFSSRNVGFIDGTALGSFRTNGFSVPFVLSGTNVEAWSAWMNSMGFSTTPVPGGAGKAASVKLLRSVLAKGLEALAIECFVAADSLGIRPTMMNAFNDFDLRSLVETLEDMGTSHVAHCKRRLDEVDHALQLLAEAHVDPIMTKASRDFYARTVDSGLQLDHDKKPSWDTCMPVLQEVALNTKCNESVEA
ncbi:MAG: NAD(P)-binding domain-containing protein [Desulfovibrio sp.]|uniref:NAD(P)-binding domain-containing protein n=1 Tax=Desulfovibrio sp. 7SRBS1 TaxID=3378064 RepID=UPI003B3EB52D